MKQKVIRNVLRIDSSARKSDSISRAIGDEVMRRLTARNPGMQVTGLDLGAGMPHIDGDWVGANFTPQDQRSAAQRGRLGASDRAVTALLEGDAVVLTAPVYNFSIPSVLKAWIDHVCRAGLTFRYTEEGPQGLLEDRPVYLVMASGGVPFGSPVDFASGYLRQVFRFLGIEDVRLIGAERVASDAQAARESALSALDEWLPEPAGRAA
jgi:FMN-dependent NADH-azoreductase